MRFRLLDPREVPWQRLDAFPDRTVFQTRAWVDFLAETQRGTPVLAELRDGQVVVGFFTGLTFRRFGIKILGSSFPGWTTPYMGFNLGPGVPRQAALQALEPFAFETLGCLHLEVCDRHCSVEDGRALGFAVEYFDTYETDLMLAEEQLRKNLHDDCRWAIRKASRSGVVIEEAHDDSFVDEYYEQLRQVFGKQKLVPTYDIGRVRALVKHLLPTGHLLLLRARSPQGDCIATVIAAGLNRVANFWGTASFQSGQKLRPNEALRWYAIQYWKRHNAEVLDWGGAAEGGDYKQKYAPVPVRIPRFNKSRYKLLGALRSQAGRLLHSRQRMLGGLARHAE
ncbi:MAG: GNAT family N-acetyltransferase [Bryobacteraceae bacterium]